MDVQAWDINLCSPDCNLIAGHIGDHEQDDPCPYCGGGHDRITRADCPEWAEGMAEA